MFADNSVTDSFLICRSASRLCAFRLEDVAETMRPLPIDTLPAMPDFVLGVALIRGAVVPVVDVAKLISGVADTRPERFVTVDLDERQVAFAVQSVLGVRALGALAMAEVPLLLHEIDANSVAAITTLDAKLLLVLQGARIITDEIWRALDSEHSVPSVPSKVAQ